MNTTVETRAKYYSMNWMRVLAFVFIIVYHYMVELELRGNYNFHESSIYYMNNNFHIAILGVSMFFMISGAGLMLSSRKHWDIKEFYRKRFTKLLIPFYIVELIALLFTYSFHSDWIAGFTFYNKRYLIFNLLGMDGYFEQYMDTFSLHVGEWFLGALIMLYVVFPIFRYFMEKNRYITIVVATIYYLVLVYSNIIPESPWTNVFVKAYDFILGMFLIIELPRILSRKKLRLALLVITLGLIVFAISYTGILATPMVINNLVLALSFFVFFFTLEDIIAKAAWANKGIDWICGISYEIFLVHHVIIYFFGDIIKGQLMPITRIGLILMCEIIVMIAFALLVKAINPKR
ncbi:MAG: acyltransferase [Pseudobutyrivibrio sp.]|nr:acyltransferase [Pseudobutyrivibrio sp.]